MTLQNTASYVNGNSNGHTSAATATAEITRKELLSTLFGERKSRPDFQAYDVSHVTEAVTCLLVAFGMPPELRALVDAVIGAANGADDWFACPDIRLARRMWPDEGSDDAKKRKLRRWRKVLVAWSLENVTVVEYQEGDRINQTTNVPTKWRCPILALAVQVLEEAGFDSEWTLHPSRAIRRVAGQIASKERLKLLTPPKRQRRPTRRPGRDTWLKSMIGFAGKFLDNSPDLEAARLEIYRELDNLFTARGPHPDPDHLTTLESPQTIDSVDPFRVDTFDPPEIENDDFEEWVDPPDLTEFDPLIRVRGGSDLSDPDPQEAPPSVVLSSITDYQALADANFFDPKDEALRALEAFRSIGIDGPLQVLMLDDGVKSLLKSISNPSQDAVQASLAEWLQEAESGQASLVFRMIGAGSTVVIQVDDCDLATVEQLRDFSFLQVETSPGSFHSWIALDCPADTFLSIRDRFLRKLGSTGANGGSYGSMRWPGSRNFKPGRNGCFIEVIFRKFGRFVTEAELKLSGLLAPPKPPPPRPTPARSNSDRKFPDYDMCIASAPRKSERDGGGPDYSRADLSFADIARARGFSEAEVEAELTNLRNAIDGKPRRHPRYVERTVATAFR